MSTQGPNSPSTGADDASTGSSAWTNPGNITAADAVYATNSSTTHYLKATGFGFSIPSGATINGITVEIKRYDPIGGGAIFDDNIRIVKGGTISSTNRSTGATWQTTPSYTTFGSSSDLWGETWTDTDINASNFGVAISCHQGGPSSASVDHIRITVDYTAGGGGGGGGSVTMPVFPAGYGRAKSITIDHTKVGAADITNFAYPVTITSDPDIGKVAHSSGQNIRFFLSDGTLLNYERISFSISSGNASGKWWVQIPTSSHTTDTVFWIAYDNPSASDGQNAASTWSSSIFDAVYHLEQDPSGSAPQMIDSRGTYNGTTNGSMTSGQSVAGKFGNGLSFDGSNDRVDCGTTLGNYSGASAFAVSCWINPTTLGSANHGIISRDTANMGWMFRITTGNAVRFILFSTGGDFKYSDTAALSTGTMYHVAGAWTGSAAKTYKNGALDSTTGTGGTLGSISQSATFYLGYDASTATYFNTIMDEVRVFKVEPTADWFSLEYNSLNSSVLTLGTEIVPTINFIDKAALDPLMALGL